MSKPLIIAVDLDGACVTHDYPKVGMDIGAREVLKELGKKGHKLILWQTLLLLAISVIPC